MNAAVDLPTPVSSVPANVSSPAPSSPNAVANDAPAGTLTASPLAQADALATDALLRAKTALEQSFEKDLLIEEFAAIAGMHPDTFSRKFKKRYGLSPVTYRLHCRLKHAAELACLRPDLTIRAIAKMSGFHHFSYFHRLFQKHFGATPAIYGGRKPSTLPPPSAEAIANVPTIPPAPLGAIALPGLARTTEDSDAT